MDKRLEDKKSIDDIAKDLCPGISKGRDKVIKIIKMHKGGQYLLTNHDWLGYHISNIRNPSGKTTYKVEPKKSERLFRPSLSIRKPSDDEYKKWLESLSEITNILLILGEEIKNTIEGRHSWKVNELKKRTVELHALMKKGITNSDNNTISLKRPEKRTKYNKTELHRRIFEIAKGQIDIVGKIDTSKISEELKVDVSAINDHVNMMSCELESMIKKWQEERDRPMIKKETTADSSVT